MGLLGSLIKTAVDVATTPLDIAADVVTLGGTLNDRKEPYTATKAKQIVDDAEKVVDDLI